MPRNPDLPCAQCGRLLWRGRTSLPEGQATCRPCRAERNPKRPRPHYRINPDTGQPEQTYTCQSCHHPWTRPAARGQVPKWCPPCRTYRAPRPCATCGTVARIMIGSSNCDDCWTSIKRGWIEKKLPAIYTGPKHQPTATVHTKGIGQFTSGKCRVCSSWFTIKNQGQTCSTKCQNKYRTDRVRAHRDRRRARKRNAYREDVHRAKVYASDGYRCHLCGKKTDPTKQTPHPKAPTIDHIIPLAAGGTHEPSNCRTACFQCNATKGHRGGGEQLLLIAV